VCVCECEERKRTHARLRVSEGAFLYIYLYMYVCMCVGFLAVSQSLSLCFLPLSHELSLSFPVALSRLLSLNLTLNLTFSVVFTHLAQGYDQCFCLLSLSTWVRLPITLLRLLVRPRVSRANRFFWHRNGYLAVHASGHSSNAGAISMYASISVLLQLSDRGVSE
jgi:hypothetical protein